ncbi:hypothetical protein QX201_004027 [Fusarium graminearum]
MLSKTVLFQRGQQSLVEIQDKVSTLRTAVQTPLLLDTFINRGPGDVSREPDIEFRAALGVDESRHLANMAVRPDPLDDSNSGEINPDRIFESLK